MSRVAKLDRETKESTVHIEVDLDGTGRAEVSTGVGFYDHMLTAFARHALVDLVVRTEGDTHIDAHHTVEDSAIVLGQALREALGDKVGIRRFGDATVPLDEALVQAVARVGTETDGSVVSPASICGLVGLKPTVGRLSRDGIVPISPSQDTAGPMTRSVADAALLYAAMAGRDDADAATAAAPDKSVPATIALPDDALRGPHRRARVRTSPASTSSTR